MLKDPNKKAARKTLNIVIHLYKKKIWNDSKTVNMIAYACNSTDPKIVYSASQFFLNNYEEAEADSSDDEGIDELKSKYKLLGKGNAKKNKKRKDKLKKLMKQIERKESRKKVEKTNKDFMPIDMINDPTSFAEKLFTKAKTNLEGNFKLKLSIMRLLGRIIGRHKLNINNFYNFMLNYLASTQKELPTICASIVESCHHITQPSELQPIIDKLFDAFICENFPPQYITVGINTLREICEKSPYIISQDNSEIVENMKNFKNKSVASAARSFINLQKDINPNMLDIYDKYVLY